MCLLRARLLAQVRAAPPNAIAAADKSPEIAYKLTTTIARSAETKKFPTPSQKAVDRMPA